MSVKDVFYRVDSTMHVFYDSSHRYMQDAQLMRTIESVELELLQRILGQTKLDNKELKKYNKYFDMHLSDGVPITFSRNYDKINVLAKHHVFFCQLSNSALSSAQVLQTYRRKDSIEKAFDEIKNYIDMGRLRTHNSDTTDGKLFCSFIALIAAMHMQNKLAVFMKENYLTKEKVILELEKMKIVQFGGNKRQYAPLSKLQKSIISEFALSEDDYISYLKHYRMCQF